LDRRVEQVLPGSREVGRGRRRWQRGAREMAQTMYMHINKE
jgi:hypothetical protein